MPHKSSSLWCKTSDKNVKGPQGFRDTVLMNGSQETVTEV